MPRGKGLGSLRAYLGLRLRPGQAQARPSPRYPSAFLHASAVGAAILPLPLARLSAGVNSDFQHKTKMAAAASREYPDENASDELGPAPLGNCSPGPCGDTRPRNCLYLTVGTGYWLLRVADGSH